MFFLWMHILIYYDSKDTLLSLQISLISAELFNLFPFGLGLLSFSLSTILFNRVTLYWIPGHLVCLAMISLINLPSIANNCYKVIVFDIIKHQQYTDWLNFTGRRQAKELNWGYPGVRSKEFLILSKSWPHKGYWTPERGT